MVGGFNLVQGFSADYSGNGNKWAGAELWKNCKIAPCCDSYLNCLCIEFYALYNVYCILCIVFSALILCTLYYTFFFYVFYY